jgi:hypothetical protein
VFLVEHCSPNQNSIAMKTTLILLTTLLLSTPLTLSAQSAGAGAAAPTGAGGSAAAPAASAGARLPQVQLSSATLAELVETLQARSKAAGHDPNTDPLNVVISPGLEEQRVPALSLRNVSPTEALTVATTVLGLRLEPVIGDAGRPVAWLIKGPAQTSPSLANAAAFPLVPMKTGFSAGTEASGLVGAASGLAGAANALSAPYAVQIAGTPATGAGGPTGFGPHTFSRVFGIAPLVASDTGDPKTREERKAEIVDRLIVSLQRMADDHGGKAQINAYRELDLLVVKSKDADVIALLTESIEAMKTNATKTGTAKQQAAESALRVELEALRGQLSIVEKEKALQRQTLLDQIDLLKQKSEETQRRKQ